MADALDAVVIIPAATVLANMNVVNANITGEMTNTSQTKKIIKPPFKEENMQNLNLVVFLFIFCVPS